MKPLKPGPGRLFLKPDDRFKIRPSGLAMPTVAQDDADHGVVVAIGEGAWMGFVAGENTLCYEPHGDRRKKWAPDRRVQSCKEGDRIFYDCTKVMIFPVDWNDTKLYILEQRDVLGVIEE